MARLPTHPNNPETTCGLADGRPGVVDLVIGCVALFLRTKRTFGADDSSLVMGSWPAIPDVAKSTTSWVIPRWAFKC